MWFIPAFIWETLDAAGELSFVLFCGVDVNSFGLLWIFILLLSFWALGGFSTFFFLTSLVGVTDLGVIIAALLEPSNL